MNKFTNVLNDTIDYFLLGDVEVLKEYQASNNLSNDLATEFTTNDSGDQIVPQGVLIPMSQITNQPYTVVFNPLESLFDQKENKLLFKKDGYVLKVTSGRVILFTWWILNDFNEDSVSKLVDNLAQLNKPFIEVENGWYDVEILGGFTKQKSTYKHVKGDIIEDYSFEPTFEIKLNHKTEKGNVTANANDSFEINPHLSPEY